MKCFFEPLWLIRAVTKRLEPFQKITSMPLALPPSCLHHWGHRHPLLEGFTPHPLLKTLINMHIITLKLREQYRFSWHIENHVGEPVHKLSLISENRKCAKLVRKVRNGSSKKNVKRNDSTEWIILWFFYIPRLTIIAESSTETIQSCPITNKKYQLAARNVSIAPQNGFLNKEDIPAPKLKKIMTR